MSLYIWQFVVALGIYLLIDAVWLSTAGPSLYATELSGMLLERPNFVVALIFYVLYTVGLVVFVINPAFVAGNIWQAVRMGAFFGLVAYATYDMTNLATLKGFTTKIALIDMVWGAALSSAVASFTVLALRYFKIG